MITFGELKNSLLADVDNIDEGIKEIIENDNANKNIKEDKTTINERIENFKKYIEKHRQQQKGGSRKTRKAKKGKKDKRKKRNVRSRKNKYPIS